MKTKGVSEIVIVTINGKEYLTFPQTIEFLGVDRGVFQQKVNREKKKKEDDPTYEGGLNIFSIGHYNFVPYEVCLKLKEETVLLQKEEKLKELSSILTIEEIQKMIEERMTK